MAEHSQICSNGSPFNLFLTVGKFCSKPAEGIEEITNSPNNETGELIWCAVKTQK